MSSGMKGGPGKGSPVTVLTYSLLVQPSRPPPVLPAYFCTSELQHTARTRQSACVVKLSELSSISPQAQRHDHISSWSIARTHLCVGSAQMGAGVACECASCGMPEY